ncbi:MAG: hypothetical protein AAF890_03455 [Pseudomonadota bacterium]
MTRFELAHSVLVSEMAKPYRYGASDCFFLGLRMIDAAMGSNHVKTYSRRYTTLKGAHRALRKDGHSTVAELFETLCDPIAPAMAQVGDVAVVTLDVDGGAADHVGIVFGSDVIIRTEQGQQRHPISSVTHAFRVI